MGFVHVNIIFSAWGQSMAILRDQLPSEHKFASQTGVYPIGSTVNYPKGRPVNIGGRKNLPPGYALVRGEIMDITNKMVQRSTDGGGGTRYYSFDNQNGAPVFRRRETDEGRRFVIFPDLTYPPGDGHYVLMKKMIGVNIPGMYAQPLYECFKVEFR